MVRSEMVLFCARIFETLHLIKRCEEEAEQEVSRVQLSVNRSEPGHARMSTARSIAQPEQMANILFMRTVWRLNHGISKSHRPITHSCAQGCDCKLLLWQRNYVGWWVDRRYVIVKLTVSLSHYWTVDIVTVLFVDLIVLWCRNVYSTLCLRRLNCESEATFIVLNAHLFLFAPSSRVNCESRRLEQQQICSYWKCFFADFSQFSSTTYWRHCQISTKGKETFSKLLYPTFYFPLIRGHVDTSVYRCGFSSCLYPCVSTVTFDKNISLMFPTIWRLMALEATHFNGTKIYHRHKYQS